MWRTSCVASLLALAGAACSPALKGSGKSVTEKREVPAFERVRVSAGLPVKISVGSTPRLEITGDDNLVPEIASAVDNGELRLQFERQGGFRTVVPLKIEVVTATLSAVSGSGGTSLEIAGVARSTFALDASGGTTASATGEVGALTIDASGGASLQLAALRARQIHLEASGGVAARLFASEAIDGKASGGASIDVAGAPPQRRVETSGGANVSYH